MSPIKRWSGHHPDELKLKKVSQKEDVGRPSNLAMRLHQYLVKEFKKLANQGKDMVPLIEKLAGEFFEQEGEFLAFEQKRQLIDSMTHELTGYGPISLFLADPEVTEVMVNGPHDVYIKMHGKIEKTSAYFRDNAQVLHIIEKMVAPLGRRIDENTPMVDACLPNGSKVNAIIPPLVRNGPTLTIRKFSEIPFTVYDLLRMGTLNENMVEFLKDAVKAKLNIIISGVTGSGKTSTLNALSSFIPNHERIVTIEDVAELKLSQEHVVSLEARPRSFEGKGEITIRDLVRNALRMQPDRIIIGEVGGSEILDMLQAMNTGCEGSLGTGHANSPRDLLARLETDVLMNGVELSVSDIREQLANALDLIIQEARMKDGSRKITRITEVLGLENGTIVLQDIFAYGERLSGDSPHSCKHIV